MTKLKIGSLNVRGLGGQHKRRDVMQYLNNMEFDIIFLQDTHLTAKKIPFFNTLWKGRSYHSIYTNNSRGTSILIDKELNHDVIFEFNCDTGNYVLLGCKIGTDTYTLGSIYGPNRDEPAFYRRIDELIDSVDCDHVIIGGDFNFYINPEKDCYGYTRENNVNARKQFNSICEKHSLTDIWRQFNPNERQFTWMRSSPNQGARLDMFFVSNHLSSLCDELKISPGYRTDHNMISMSMEIGETRRGPGLWKFNESLLNDVEYVNMVNICIDRTVEQYALPVYTQNFLLDEGCFKDIQFQISDDLFYETLLMMIRGETIKFSKRKAKRTKEKEKELLTRISNAHSQFCDARTDENAFRLKKYQEELENLRKPIISGLIVRSRTRWHEEGERSSKYFLGLEKRNALRKSVTVIKRGEQILTRTCSILDAFSNNLSNKYNKEHTMPPSADIFIKRHILTHLSDHERIAFEQPLSYEELTEALNKMKKGKSPGSNGYTSNFFKYFWNRLGPFLYKAFIFRSRSNTMPMSHREGIITMIPKAGKPPDNIKAWRPITLLNTDFKIISAAIAARLQQVMSKLIDPCQTAYIKGRYIGENTRLIFDVINNVSKNNGTGLIMSVDFEAAFDSLSWDFVSRVLKGYNFGSSFRNLVRTIYFDNANFSRIMLNGHLGNKIFLNCGIRQGDPASGYLFNLAVNILANQIKQTKRLTGIRLSENHEVRISQYADDTVLFLNNSSTCVQEALSELSTFSSFSGLNLNIEKTVCLPIGTQEQETQCSTESFDVKWVKQIKILGITFSDTNHRITQTNIEPKIVQIQKEIAQWRRRNLTPLGKITVIKSLLISKLVHLLTALPNPTQPELKQIERLFFSFLWGGKRDPIKRAKVIQNVESGGLNMIDIQAFVRSMKLTWLKRLMTSNAEWAKLAANELPNIDSVLQFGSKKLHKIRSEIGNPFWQDVLDAFSRFSHEYKPGMPDILSESMWFSDHTKFHCTVVKDWRRRGLRFLADLIDDRTGHVCTREAIRTKFGINMTFLCYTSLLRSLPECVKEIAANTVTRPIIPLRINVVMNHPKFARFAYETALKHRLNELDQTNALQEQKWIRDVGCFEANSFVNVIKVTNSTRIRMFHYKLVNRILTTNRFLKIINVKDDDMCTFCQREPETLSHMFWHCAKVRFFINNLTSDIMARYKINLRINIEAWFFLTNVSAIEGLIITLAKLVIYDARHKESLPNIIHLRNKLKYEAEIEHTAARLGNKLYIFENKWGPLKDTHLVQLSD